MVGSREVLARPWTAGSVCWPTVALFLLLLATFCGQARAQGEPRWALVIGNNTYQHVGSLKTAGNDAAAVAATLRQLRFEVLERQNLDRARMYRAVRELAEHAAGGIAVIYYAGHGVQVRGRSFLLPVDLDPQSEGEVEDNAVPLDDVLGLLAGARAKLTVVFVDACRDNPLPPAARGLERGLAEPRNVPRGQMVIYAAGAGEEALDRLGPGDEDPNGLFVRELLPELRRPGVALDDAVDAAAERVAQEAAAAGHEQNPAIYKAYRGKFYLTPDRRQEVQQREQAAGAYGGEDRPAVTDCDRLAGSPLDKDRITAGVDIKNVDRERAILACKEAVERWPREARLAYEYGRALETRDDAQAVAWLRKAAEQGYAAAQNNLSRMYDHGRGVALDEAQAVAWLRKAAEQGDADAQSTLSSRYWLGSGVAKDEAQAVAWLRKAAEQGNAQTQYNLAVLYDTGRVVAKDEAQAGAWYRKAAEQGYALAQDSLGWMYEKGLGVAQDDAQAVAWYRKAAEQGDALGQDSLGRMYENGRGVAQDNAAALAWYRKAAEQGYAAAKEDLKRLGPGGLGQKPRAAGIKLAPPMQGLPFGALLQR